MIVNLLLYAVGKIVFYIGEKCVMNYILKRPTIRRTMYLTQEIENIYDHSQIEQYDIDQNYVLVDL